MCVVKKYHVTLSMTPPVTRGVAHLEISTVDSNYYKQDLHNLKNNYKPPFVFIEDGEKF